MPHELPERLDVWVTVDGEPVEGAFVHLRLPVGTGPMTGYGLVLGPTDVEGNVVITRFDLERRVRPEPGTGAIAANLGDWDGSFVLTPVDVEAVRRVEQGTWLWDESETLPHTYAPDFVAQARRLGKYLEARPGRRLSAGARATGGSRIGIACRMMHT